MTKYVWLFLNTGRFSNSWTIEEAGKSIDDITTDKAVMAMAAERNWKLIKYECLNDDSFSLYDLMQIVTTKK